MKIFRRKMAKGASFELHKGEDHRICGELVGAGRSEVMKCIFRIDEGCNRRAFI